jgi:23S rRNA (uracil1939-C5)-methyltransferase
MIGRIRIESLAYGGSGVGRLDGKAVFVPFTAPGDLVECRLTVEKKRYAEGEMVALLGAAPVRRTAPCPVFGQCGGCQWQHLPYREQVRWKEIIFTDTLKRRCGLENAPLPLLGAADEWGYRSRVQIKCRQTQAGFVTGFYRQGSHYVVDIDHCPITHSRLNEILRFLKPELAGSPFASHMPQVDMAVDDDGRVRIVVHYIGPDAAAIASFLRPLAENGGFATFLQTGRKETIRHIAGSEDLEIRLDSPPLRLCYGPGGFAQVNLAQNRRLVEEVVAAAALTGKERVLDLFCGMGNFSLPLAIGAAEVIGVEDYAPAIAKARQNAQRLGITNTRFLTGAAAEMAVSLGHEGRFDLVVLDPPRTGAYDVVRKLLLLKPRRIMYISCDPSTLARDLMPLLHSRYHVVRSRPLDLFPQTFHMESMTLLELL